MVIKVKDKNMSDGSQTLEIPKEWLKRAETQQKRVNNMTPEERRAWGFKPGETLEEKQNRDELDNPSK